MKTLFAIALLLATFPALADLAIIAHPSNHTELLTLQEARDLFLGRTRAFPDERAALPLDQATPLRADFYQKLTDRSIEQIDAYWARLLFSGQTTPPPRMPDDAAVLKAVRENPGAIGYIDKTHLDRSVRVLLVLP